MDETERATDEQIRLFHTESYLARLKERSARGQGYLDVGDTPAFMGIYEAAADVVGGSLRAAEAIMQGRARRAFVPIAGLHHAARDGAAGFCALNDCAIVI